MKLKVPNKAHLSDEVTDTEKNSAKIAYEAALEGIVLLENDGTLPVRPGRIALYGAGGGMTIKGGSGSGEVNERHAFTIEEGLATAGFTVTTGSWLSDYKKEYAEGLRLYREEARKKPLKDAVNAMADPYQYPFGRRITAEDIAASDTDVCVYVIARQAGEGADRKLERLEYKPSEQELENIRICAENYKKCIVVINVGGVFDTGFMEQIKGIGALVFYCQQGSQGGRAFADLLCGRANFSGHLTSTWARDYYDYPGARDYSYMNGNTSEEYYREGIYVGYRYFDSFHVEPRYPFGYGLSYTGFKVRCSEIRAADAGICVTAEVENAGDKAAGKGLVQVYVSCPQTGIAKEYQRLAAFAKTRELQPGEKETLVLSFAMADMASFAEARGETVLSAGRYTVRIGQSSRDTQACGYIELKEEIVTGRYASIVPVEARIEEIAPPVPEQEAMDEALPCLVFDAGHIQTRVVEYKKPAIRDDAEVKEMLRRIPTSELVRLLAGPGYFGGKKWREVPGAAGYTTGDLQKYGIPNVSLCDGPAGLRLQRTSAVTKSGTVKMIDVQIDLLNNIRLPKLAEKIMYGDPQKDTLIYQYTTSFPVGLALAQTWNGELVRSVGRAVSLEMSEYGASYWLAPALNIHRNPLCGRNFEYYSEDPLVAGKIAAAMCLGVQESGGNFTTIKHFCCNNQEDNRNHINECLNERALREIYLKAFEIAVKEGRPGSVMSSYNKVNGVYVNNNYDLLTKVLRNEWGYEGFVMTDWFATGKGVGDHAGAIKAGNDLIEPGGPGAVRAIRKGLKSGRLSENEIRWCAANVLYGVLQTRTYREFRAEKKIPPFRP